MKDEHRARLENRLTPIHLYKLTPKTNCGECGFASCLAFATQVIVGQADLGLCRYLDENAVKPFREQLAEQHGAGIGIKKEGFEKALQFLRSEIRKWNFQTIGQSLGADYREISGLPALSFPYFGSEVTVTCDDISAASGEALDPYEKILIYNYVIGGATEPAGTWVGMESLPNSVSKRKSLKAHCEDRLSEASIGKTDLLAAAVRKWGSPITAAAEHADFAAEFQILPRLAIRILWWDEDLSEGFAARTKFLFDARVLNIVDLESLLFACEQLTDRIVNALGQT